MTDYPPRLPRVPLDVVVLRADDVEPGIYAAVDISAGGLCLRSQRKETLGGFVALGFKLGDADLQVYAEVIWCNAAPEDGPMAGLYTTGLKFMNLSPRHAELIQAFIDEHSSD